MRVSVWSSDVCSSDLHLLLPLLGLAVLPAAVHGQPEGGDGLPGGREAQLRVAGDVAYDGDGVVSHVGLLPGRGGRLGLLAKQAAAGGLMVGQAHKLVADDLVRKAQRPLQTFEVSAVGGDLPDDVDALCLVVALVGEPPATPPVGGGA